MRITCAEGDPQLKGYFGLTDAYGETAPRHRLARAGARIDPCRWRIVDRNGVEGLTYNVTFSSDGSSLIGLTTGYHWLARADLTFLFNGVRQ